MLPNFFASFNKKIVKVNYCDRQLVKRRLLLRRIKNARTKKTTAGEAIMSME